MATLSGVARADVDVDAHRCSYIQDFYDITANECRPSDCFLDLSEGLSPLVRGQRARENELCAYRLEYALDGFRGACHQSVLREEVMQLLLDAVSYWIGADSCAPGGPYLERALGLLNRTIADIQATLVGPASGTPAGARDPFDAVKHLEAKRDLILRAVKDDRGDASSTVVSESLPAPSSTALRPVPPQDRRHRSFTLRLGGGLGGIPALAYDDGATTFHAAPAVVPVYASGAARFSFGADDRSLLDLGVNYLMVGGALEHVEGDVRYKGFAREWVHNLAPFVRFGYAVHPEQFSVHGEVGVGLQVFSTGANFGTALVRAAGSACTLWGVLCLDAGYISGWGGLTIPATNYAQSWTLVLGLDVLRLPDIRRRDPNRRAR